SMARHVAVVDFATAIAAAIRDGGATAAVARIAAAGLMVTATEEPTTTTSVVPRTAARLRLAANRCRGTANGLRLAAYRFAARTAAASTKQTAQAAGVRRVGGHQRSERTNRQRQKEMLHHRFLQMYERV